MNKPRNDLTAKFVRSILDYNPRSGIFRWKKRTSKRVRKNLVGKRAGVKHHTGYIYIKINGRLYGAHRLAWLFVTGRWPKHQIDHKNGRKSSNSFKNLRDAKHQQNGMNRRKLHPATSNLKGVSFVKKSGKWQAMIMLKGKHIFLGLFSTAEAGHRAYRKAARKLHGKFANSGSSR